MTSSGWRGRQAIQLPEPPLEDWASYSAKLHRTTKQGSHRLFVGPTQSGKTLLCRYAARDQKYVVVIGTKPRDISLDAYLKEGYRRIEQWPPKAKDLAPDPETGDVRLILWPKIVKREDLRRHRGTFQRFFEEAFVEGHWCIVADEGLWIASRKGLGLDQELADLAYGGASNKVSLYLCIQRPSGLSRVTWSSVSDAYIFHGGVTDDIRELATLGTYDAKDVARIIKSGLKGHQFLALPCRGQAEWAISEVDVRA